MNKNVFFSRTGSSCKIYDELKKAIDNAQYRILGTAYYLTNPNIIDSINNSPVTDKRFILDHFDEDYILNDSVKCVVIGNTKEIKMHHKFIIIDNQVWTGSFNLSRTAQYNNFEHLVRLPRNGGYTEEFFEEFKKLFSWGLAQRTAFKYVQPQISKIDGDTVKCISFPECSDTKFDECAVVNGEGIPELCDLVEQFGVYIKNNTYTHFCRDRYLKFKKSLICNTCNCVYDSSTVHIIATAREEQYICTDCLYNCI